MINSCSVSSPSRWALITQIVLALSLFLVLPTLQAQDPYQAFSIDFGGDLFIHQSSSASTPTNPCPVGPDGSITFGQNACAEQFSTVGAFTMGMGIRPLRHLQIDPFELSILGNYANWGPRSSSFTCVSGCTTSAATILPISSDSLLVTTGARAVWPLSHERFLLSAGGGFAWLTTVEHAQASGNEQVQCLSCQEVDGHGATAVAEVLYMFGKNTGVGVNVRYVNIGSSGMTLAANVSNTLLGTKYRDGFFLTGAEISIRFGTRHH